VLCVGSALYALGLAIMARSTTPEELSLSAGVLIGLGLSGCSFNIVLGAFGKLLPENGAPLRSARARLPARSGNSSIRRSRSR